MQRIVVTPGEQIEVNMTANPGANVLDVKFKITTAAVPAPPPPAPSPAAGPWSPPLGIPEPEFGIRELAPPPPAFWDAEVPGHYFVDMYDARAGDTIRYGTPEKPRRTIPALLPAGAVVWVRGNYDYAPTGYSNLDGAGTPEAPIFVRSAPGGRARFRRDLHVVGSYIIIEGVDFAARDENLVGQPVLLAPAHHVCLRDSDISGNKKKGGALLVSWDPQRAHDLVLLRCAIHDCGDVLSPIDQDQHGVSIGNVDRAWVLDCDISKNSGDGVQVNGGQAGQARTNHIYVGRNRSHANKQAGLWTKQATDVVFSQNVVSGHRPGNSSPGAGLGQQYAPERAWWIYNEVTDCEMGLFAGSDSGLGTGREAFAVGNKITDCIRSRPIEGAESGWSPAAMTLAGGAEWWLAANKVDHASAGIYSPNKDATLHLDGNSLTKVAPGKLQFVDGKVLNEPLGAKLSQRFQALYGISMLPPEAPALARGKVDPARIGGAA